MLDSFGVPESMRPTDILSVEEAEKQVRVAKTQLFVTWDKLHSIVVSHEDMIRKRWGNVRIVMTLLKV